MTRSGAAPRVLVLSGLQVHPTTSGGTLRTYALVGALRRHGLEVRVHSLTGRKRDYLARRRSSTEHWPDGTEEQVERGPLSALDWLAGYVLSPPPLWISAHLAAGAASPRERLLSRRLRAQLRWCDAVVADFPFCAPIFSAPSARGKLRVLSTHNVEHHLLDGRNGWRRRLLRAAVRRLELRGAAACDLLVSCCPEDARFFEAHAAARRTVTVPNGIDPRRFVGLEARRAEARRGLGIPESARVFFLTASNWGPNREAFAFLLGFARAHAALLRERGIHLLVVGTVTPEPVRFPGFTATGRVDRVEPYFAAADAALNPLLGGAGTNVKMCEFIAARLPILTTPFGARGFELVDGESAFLFEREDLAPVLGRVRRLFDEDPARLGAMAAAAYARNEAVVDMDACVRPLADALGGVGGAVSGIP
jgi:glycosyltransferase involved in cell wall biosynthesis